MREMANQGEQISSIQSAHLDLPPSCLEFCPVHPSYFLVGTYNLQKNDAAAESDNQDEEQDQDKDEKQSAKAKLQSRNGTILVFNLIESRFSHIQTEEQPSALLDLRFNPNAGKEDICAAVSSTSTLALFKLDPSLNRPLSHIKTMDMTTMSNGALTPEPETEVLFLAFAWHPSKADMVAITTNTGHVYIVDLGDVNGSWEMHSKPVITHDLEAWCVSIAPCIDPAIPSYENAFILYSGGDDSILRSQTCVLEKEQEPQSEPTRYAIDRSLPPSKLRGHDAGVTAILPLHPKAGKPSLVVTGSYDDHIRLFSLSSTSPYSPLRAQNLAESNLGGGVWRLKLIDMDNEHSGDRRYLWRARILASCMHVGARVVELLQTADDEYSFRTVGRFEEHQSMNYGSDFHPGSVASNKLTVVSSSFYDKLMCLWEMEL